MVLPQFEAKFLRRGFQPFLDLARPFDVEINRHFQTVVEFPEIRAVLVNLHSAVIGLRRRFDLAVLAGAAGAASLADAQSGERQVWFDGGFRATPVYQREAIPRKARFAGPAIIEQLDCTTVIEPGNSVRMDAIGNLEVLVQKS